MRLVENAEHWDIVETARGLGVFVAVLGVLALLAFRGASGAWRAPADLAAPGAAWFATGLALLGLGALLVKRRRWRFDFVRREAWLETRGLLWSRRVIPFAALRRIAVPAGAMSFGKPVGRLVLFHAAGVEQFRPDANTREHAAVDAIARKLADRLGLAGVADTAILQELLAGGAYGDAILAVRLLEGVNLYEARLRVERAATAGGVRPTTIELLRAQLRELSLEQVVLLALFLPLILLALLFGRRRV
jgi:membrane protein YdbS with pleckstrin-like domain